MVTIYGFGNALIDIHLSISEDQLLEIGIAKNTMKHIDEEEMLDLLARYDKNIVNKSPGGSIANSLYAANKHKCKTFFNCALKQDLNGETFLDGFSKTNHKNFISKSSQPTGSCLIFNTPDGQRTMASYLGANRDLSSESLNKVSLMSSDWLLFDTFTFCSQGGYQVAKEALNIAKENNISICYGLSDITLLEPNKASISWLIEQDIHYIVGNNEEFLLFNKLFNFPRSRQLITKGENGATLDHINIKAKNISTKSTNGAGDALTGTFIALVLREGKQRALERAVEYASSVCLFEEPRL